MFAKLKQFQEEREEGFTLIELLVVILIIGILSAIAIPAFLNQRKSAVDSSVQSDVSNAAKQIETAIVKAGSTEKTLIGTGTATPTQLKIDTTTIKTSDGTALVVSGTSFAYTITATNTGGDQAVIAKGGFVYSSANGGLKPGVAGSITGTPTVGVTVS